jgi:aspartate oxidase
MNPHRPVIIGTGIAGLWTAWRLASEGQRAVVLTKETLADSASAWAQGGIAVALGPGDSPSQHAADTLAASDGLADPEVDEARAHVFDDVVHLAIAADAALHERHERGRVFLDVTEIAIDREKYLIARGQGRIGHRARP